VGRRIEYLATPEPKIEIEPEPEPEKKGKIGYILVGIMGIILSRK
jgi:hypothetical protein|tara:strand:- start:351 stop:485 length:135 start_codon:yes stop_codon:yes gene_type:complete